MVQTTNVPNAIPILKLEEVVIGSQLRLAAYFERLVDDDPETFEPIDFTDWELKADIKLKPNKEVEPDANFVCTPRVVPGWVDFVLDGTSTGSLLQKTYKASVKIWPVGHPEQGETLWVIVLPMKFEATR